jgi:hypothetical protein
MRRKKKRSSEARGEILTGFEIDPKQSKKLKTVFFTENHSKVLKKKSGSSADEICRSCWFAYKHMFFSCKVMKQGKEKTQ